MSRSLTTVFALLVTLTVAAAAAAADLGIVTGGEKGTYYQFGLDLQALAKRSGDTLAVHPSRGSIENVYAVYQRPGVQMGIVQSDVLAFVARVQTDPVLKRIAKKTRLVFPLYNEEVHLLAHRGITAFEDLADKRVAIGREGSGNYLTARLLLNLAEVAPREMLLIDTDEALAELKAGRIDAMFYVAGYPVRLFAEGVTEADGLALVPIVNKSITEFYPSVEIPPDTYRWQPQPVATVAVKAALVSFDYRRNDCENVGRFARMLADNVDWLRANGHPKWKTVDLEYQLKGWEQYDCVRRHLGRRALPASAASRSGSGNPVMDVIREILGD
ncbi:MAG TPA: TAXI family TRAP transporter solute-binding subunit [Thermodesulfobacteriota bacterium]